jgi:hypothetical protein
VDDNTRSYPQVIKKTYTKEKNGIAERRNGILKDMTLAIIHSANLPFLLWPLALRNATQIINACHSVIIKGIPEFKNSGVYPDITRFKSFGCLAYPLIMGDDKKKSLDVRAEQGIFLGLAKHNKGYLIYVPSRGKLLETRHVTFEENRYMDLPSGYIFTNFKNNASTIKMCENHYFDLLEWTSPNANIDLVRPRPMSRIPPRQRKKRKSTVTPSV